jgi:hypothetical protein
MNYNTLHKWAELKKDKNKEKLQFNEPRLNSTRSSSFDLELDELQAHFDPFLIPAQNHKAEEEIMPSGKATWQIRKEVKNGG